MSFLLDTNVISELRKNAGNKGVREWYSEVSPTALYLSVLTLGEIGQGISRLRQRNDNRQAEALVGWLSQMQHGYSSRILAIDADVTAVWGEIAAARPLPVVDALLAATALVHRLTLVTRNVQDFDQTGVRLLNPFS